MKKGPRKTAVTPASIFKITNRGLLLDIVVFIANLFLMRLLTGQFIKLFNEVSAENPLAQFVLTVVLIAMWVLPAAGAVLKRWRFQQRRDAVTMDNHSWLAGCLFNPLFYFCLNLVISAAIFASAGNLLFGSRGANNAPVFVSGIFAIMFLTIVQTYLIYSYFSPRKKPPRWEFLRTPQSETLGDVCLFLNMILFQVFWNMLTFAGLGRPSGAVEFFGRLFFLSFIALLIYFPPRMFYLAEDINRRRTWLMMLLANSPVIVRVLIGTGSNASGW
jgi:hypothetical protein